MFFPPRPSYSNKQIQIAGKLIIKTKSKSKEYLDSLKIINSWRIAHAYPINTFNTYLRKQVKGIKNVIVAQRLKRLPTIIDKLKRYPNMSLVTMQDIGGLRAILNSVAEVKKIQDRYTRSTNITHELKEVKDYIEYPKESGYRGVHLIYKYNNIRSKNESAKTYKGMLLEIQLRTNIQHSWATAVETVGLFQEIDYKSGKGKDEWLEFFSLVSAVFASIEKSPTLPQYLHLNTIQIIEKLIKIEKKFELLNQLAGYSFAVKVNQESTGHYSVIVLNYKEKVVTVKSFNKDELDSASSYLALVEASSSKNKIDAVLVSAGRLKKMRKAYPNYFLDMRVFIDQVKVIVNESRDLYNK